MNVGLAEFVDIVLILWLVLLVMNLILQIICIMKTICFMSKSKIIRVVAFILLLPLAAIYINDTLIILVFSWGVPAFLMTQYSRDL